MRTGFGLCVLLSAGFIACGGSARSPAPSKPTPSEAEDFCAQRTGHPAQRYRIDPAGAFCETRGSDPGLEKRMIETLAGGGANLRRFTLRCRADVCSVKCVTMPRQQCVEELHSVIRWSAPRHIFVAIAFYGERGQAVFTFPSKEYFARRELNGRIARLLHDSPALAACKQNATVHGVLLLYIDVPASGTPSVIVRGDIADTPDADCVSKALLAAVIDSHITPPLPNLALPIVVRL